MIAIVRSEPSGKRSTIARGATWPKMQPHLRRISGPVAEAAIHAAYAVGQGDIPEILQAIKDGQDRVIELLERLNRAWTEE